MDDMLGVSSSMYDIIDLKKIKKKKNFHKVFGRGQKNSLYEDHKT